VIVADTSAWVEFFRKSGHAVARELARLIRADAELAITEVVAMELLAGTRAGAPTREVRSRLLAFPLLSLEGLGDYEEAAAIYRNCRDGGRQLRGLTDCLIAIPVIRTGASLLHNDADFEVIARHAPLRIHRA
jgi:predicted nucleic acid-binding protein